MIVVKKMIDPYITKILKEIPERNYESENPLRLMINSF